jgi:hypothetical protein
MNTGMKITITAETGNSAFSEKEDIRETLKKGIDKMIDGNDLAGSIFDYNGNVIGHFIKSFPKRKTI